MIASLILFCLFVIWLLVPITPPSVCLDVRYRTDGVDTEVCVTWPDEVDKGIPFAADIYLVELDSIKFPYTKVFDSSVWRSVYFVRTDVYPLAWLQWWIIFRIEESRRLSELAVVYILAVWGLFELKRYGSPKLKDLLIKR